MELNKDDLEQIERIAAAAYTPKQVAYMLGIKPSDMHVLVMDEDSDVARAYFKGLYSSELSIRESIMTLARNGSSPAQSLSKIIFNENRKELLKVGYPSVEE